MLYYQILDSIFLSACLINFYFHPSSTAYPKPGRFIYFGFYLLYVRKFLREHVKISHK